MRGAGQASGGEQVHLRVDDLACRRGERLLFAGLSFALGAGQAALITGPNGIGKSSLLRMLCGLLPVFGGTIALGGAVSLVDDRLALDSDRSLKSALGFWTRVDDRDEAACDEAMRALALDPLADVPVRMLSTGQRKRATLARTLGSGAAIWLLDEPANGLDEASIALLGVAVRRHLDGGGIVVAASHQPLPWPSDVAFTLTRPAGVEDEA